MPPPECGLLGSHREPAAPSSFRRSVDDRLDVEDRGSIESFQGLHPDAAGRLNFQHFHAVQADGIGAVRRARGKNASQGSVPVSPGMDLQDVAASFVKPGQDEYGLPRGKPVETLREGRIDFQPCLGRSFGTLPGAVFTGDQR